MFHMMQPHACMQFGGMEVRLLMTAGLVRKQMHDVGEMKVQNQQCDEDHYPNTIGKDGQPAYYRAHRPDCKLASIRSSLIGRKLTRTIITITIVFLLGGIEWERAAHVKIAEHHRSV
jgi:hypothetical protein